jgi:hypothetical protein
VDTHFLVSLFPVSLFTVLRVVRHKIMANPSRISYRGWTIACLNDLMENSDTMFLVSLLSHALPIIDPLYSHFLLKCVIKIDMMWTPFAALGAMPSETRGYSPPTAARVIVRFQVGSGRAREHWQ